MTDQKHVLVIGSMRLIQQELVAITHVRTTNIKRLSKIRSEDKALHRRVLGLDESCNAEWVACAEAIHRRDPFDHVVAYHELDQDKAGVIAEALHLAFHSRATLDAVIDKCAMRKVLLEKNIPSVPFLPVDTLDDIVRFGERYGYPLIVKPRSGWASEHIIKCASFDDFVSKRAMIDSLVGQRLIVEQFIPGSEYSVEAMSENGIHFVIGITEKLKDPVTFVETGHSFPAMLDSTAQLAIERYMNKFLDALGVQYGPTHTELIFTPGGPVAVETHTRTGGDSIPDLINEVYGLNLYSLVAKQSIGESVLDTLESVCSVGHQRGTYSSIMFYTPSTRGRVIDVQGEDQARSIPGVVNVSLAKTVGDSIGPVRNSFDRAFSVIASGRSANESRSRCQEAANFITYQLGNADD